MVDSNDDFVAYTKRLCEDWDKLLFPKRIPGDQPVRICLVQKNSAADAGSLSEEEVEACFPKIDGLTDRSVQTDSLRKKYPDWWAQRKEESPDQVIYALPKKVILTAKSLFSFSDADAQAEREFTRICEVKQAIGICGQLFIDGITTPGDLSRTAEDFKSLERQIRSTRTFTLTEDQMKRLRAQFLWDWRDRQLAASGMLLCDGQFQEDRLALRQRWLELPLNVRPWLPDFRLRPSMSRDDRQVEVFLESVHEFKERWHIDSIATWDYVVARGPRMPDYRSNTEGNYYPPLYRMRRVEMPNRKEFEDYQRQEDAANLLKERRRSDSYRRMFVTHFWNHVLEQRYRPVSGSRRRGFVSKTFGLIAAIIDVEACAVRVKTDLRIFRRLQTGKQQNLGRS
jgi:hypothetical protein